MSKKVTAKSVLSRIVLRLKGKEISLSVEEAKELKEILSELFGKDRIDYVPYWPYWPQWKPYWTYWTNGTSTGDTQTISCGSTCSTDTVFLSLNQ